MDEWKLDLTDPEAWKKSVAANCIDGYGFSVTFFATKWMMLMQKRLIAGEKVADIAEETSHEADKWLGNWGLTGFQYGLAVSVIAQVWSHGDELRRWHNRETQMGTEGDEANEKGGTLNPAILNIGAKE